MCCSCGRTTTTISLTGHSAVASNKGCQREVVAHSWVCNGMQQWDGTADRNRHHEILKHESQTDKLLSEAPLLFQPFYLQQIVAEISKSKLPFAWSSMMKQLVADMPG